MLSQCLRVCVCVRVNGKHIEINVCVRVILFVIWKICVHSSTIKILPFDVQRNDWIENQNIIIEKKDEQKKIVTIQTIDLMMIGIFVLNNKKCERINGVCCMIIIRSGWMNRLWCRRRWWWWFSTTKIQKEKKWNRNKWIKKKWRCYLILSLSLVLYSSLFLTLEFFLFFFQPKMKWNFPLLFY